LVSVLEDSNIGDPEGRVSDIWQEISRRHRLVPKAHPVKVFGDRLERIQLWMDNPVYAFQLLLTLQRLYDLIETSSGQWGRPAKLFELLTTSAAAQYLGDAINIGTPRRGDVPRSFGRCLDYICKKLGEVKGTTTLYTSTVKDDGVDIIAWRSFKDGRSSQVIILINCAAGAGWRGKLGEISLSVWRDHINWATDPIKAFAVPFVVDDAQWMRLCKEAEGVLFDRLRIAAMCEIRNDLFRAVQTELVRWCRTQLRRLPWSSK
jgi:hypothetical protein